MQGRQEAAMAVILIPLPKHDFDPTEAAVPWLELNRRGHQVHFATPDGGMAEADLRMVNGSGLGPWKALLRADTNGLAAYSAMIEDPTFKQPWDYKRAASEAIDGLVLPGGHAKRMREYLESKEVQAIVTTAFERDIPVGAICHGVVVAARSKRKDGQSVLFDRKTTALTRTLELTGWVLTVAWLGSYYRTYPETVQDEVIASLAEPAAFLSGPLALSRDSQDRLDRGFTVRDGNYLSARWPGDAHRFAKDYADMLE
jgi:protease I